MRKKAILAFVLAAVLLLSSCALVEKDLAVDNATVIIQLGDETISKIQVNNALETELYYQAQYYSMLYGTSIDTTDPEIRANLLDSTLDNLAQQLVLRQKARELGFETFTADEDTAIRETAQSNMDSDKEAVKAEFFADTALEGEALEAGISQKMTELGLIFDQYYESAKAEAAQKKLRDSVIASVTVTDEEIQTEYDSRVAEGKTSYESNLSAYGSSVNSNRDVFYTPAGYRYVKHILRKFSNENTTALTDLQTKIGGKTNEIASIDTSISGLPEGTAQDDPERVKLTADKAALEKEKVDLQVQYDKTLEDAYIALQPTVDEVLTKLSAGEDFDALMETYGEDPGMKNSPQKENGYAVCQDFADFDPAFTGAAMALAAVGDVSPAVRGQSGIHILKYVSDIAEGPVALDAVKETVSAEILSTKQNDAYSAQVTAWVEQSGVKIFKDRMN